MRRWNRSLPAAESAPAGDLFGCSVRENREVLGLLPVRDFVESFGNKPTLEQLPYRGSSARHPFCKAPRINGPNFLGREHDLKALTSIDLTHPTLSYAKASKPQRTPNGFFTVSTH
jgi:hypothetical protein